MNCTAVENIIDYYIDNKLTDKLKNKVEKHIATCPRCAREVRVYLKMKQLMTNYTVPQMPENLKSSVLEIAYSEEKSKAPYFNIQWKLSPSYGVAVGYFITMLLSALISFGIPTQAFAMIR
jgi:anti-sigma factor RsiW